MFIVPQTFSSLYEPVYQNYALSAYWVMVKGEVFRLFSSTFLHSDAMHIIMNMVSLYIVGTMVERIFSKTSYLTLYFITAFFGSFASIYIHSDGWAVGASGAIFGLFGALAGFAFVHRHTMREQFIGFMKNFGAILVINLVIGIAVPNIDISAHIGGLVAGVIGGIIIAKNPKFVWGYLVFSMILLSTIYTSLLSLYVS